MMNLVWNYMEIYYLIYCVFSGPDFKGDVAVFGRLAAPELEIWH